jgi:hypothetical protein
MQPDPIREGSLQTVDPQDIGEKFYELIDLLRDTGTVQMLFYMQHAAAGRRHDIIEFRKIFYEQVVTPCREVLETGIGHGLPATGLVRWIDYIAAKLFEQFQGGDAHLRIKLVDITGYE